MSEARRKALADPEVRARMSEARRKAWADRDRDAVVYTSYGKALDWAADVDPDMMLPKGGIEAKLTAINDLRDAFDLPRFVLVAA